MAAQSSGRPINSLDSDENEDLFLPPPSGSSNHLVHLQNNGSKRHMLRHYQSFSSDMEDDCFYPTTECCDLNSDTTNEASVKQPDPTSLSYGDYAQPPRLMRQSSIVDGLLHEIYDHWHGGRHDSFDSDTLTECSSTSELLWCSRHDISTYSLEGGYQSTIERRQAGSFNRSFLQTQDTHQLRRLLSNVQRMTAVMSARLVRQLKRRDRRLVKRKKNYDVLTAILQAASLKRQIDTRMRFSIQPPTNQPSAFDQWKDAMRAVCRLPMGIPTEFRKKVWLSLADHYLVQLRINWDKTLRFAFNERSNPDDDKLGMQIVKDLHRTGCSNFSGDDNVEDRAILKRVLLAYARWNKRVGYCQGFNVIAALLLNVMDRKEDDALKVMIFLIDNVLPESYFANNLRALSVDMAVFRDLLALTYPRLSKHLDRLQLQAQDVRTGACYEPPLTNVFTMQWFLTLFATCLPVNIVLRVWDSVLLEGSEILLRTALTIWGKLSKRILGVSSADEFYSVMGELSSSIMQGSLMDADCIIKSIYSLGDFPFPHLNELREKYTYNIRPLTPATSSGGKKVNGGRSLIKAMLYSDDDEMDDDDITAMACMPGEMGSSPSTSSSDISVLGPGVYGPGLDPLNGGRGGGAMQMERMSTDINSLKLQYERLKERQQQAHIIIAAASQKKAQLISSSAKKSSPSASPRGRRSIVPPSMPPSILLPCIESPIAMNHLFVGKGNRLSASAKNRLVTEGPRISQPPPAPHTSAVLSKQLQAVANAQAVSKSHRMRSATKPKGNEKPVQSTAMPNTANPAQDCSLSTESIRYETPPAVDVTDCVVSEDRLGCGQSEADMTQDKELNSLSKAVDSDDISDKCVQTSFDSEPTEERPIHSVEPVSCLSSLCSSSNVEKVSGISCDNSQSVMICDADHQVPYCDKKQCIHSSNPTIIENEVSPSIQTLNEEASLHSQTDSKINCFLAAVDGSVVEFHSHSQSLHPDCMPDDSGIESSSTASPSTTPKRKIETKTICEDEIPSELVSHTLGLEEENVLSVRAVISPNGESHSISDNNPLSQGLSDPHTKMENDLLVVREGNHDIVIDNFSEIVECDDVSVICSEKKTDVEEAFITDHQISNADTTADANSGEKLISQSHSKDSSRNLKVSLSDLKESHSGSNDVPTLLSIATTSPQRKFFHRSNSINEDSYVSSPGVIETVPVPENLDGYAPPSHNQYRTCSKSTSFRQQTEDLAKTKPRRSSNKTGPNHSHHSTERENVDRDNVKANLTSSSVNKNFRRYSTPAHLTTPDSKVKSSMPMKPHNPFPVKLFTANRAKTGLKLGLYTATTLEQLKGLKPARTSST